jgi:hypothetical protein
MYSDDLAKNICVRLSEGESLKSICLSDDMPHRSTVYDWLFSMPAFADMYARAREEQAETMADEIIEIADESSSDWMITERGTEIVNNEAISRSKLRVEARKWVAAKLKPKKYGEFTRTELTGANGGAIKTEATVDLSKASDDVIAALMALRVKPAEN